MAYYSFHMSPYMGHEHSGVDVIVGVDFGQRYSGFAYTQPRKGSSTASAAEQEDALQRASAAGAGAGAGQVTIAIPGTAQASSPSPVPEESNIPTALLYVRQGEGGEPRVVHWGASAEQEQIKLLHQQQGSTTTIDTATTTAVAAQPARATGGHGVLSYTLVTGFKQFLETEPSRLVLGAATDPPSATVTARQATTHFLKELRQSALQRVRAVYWDASCMQVRWSLTVPSGWSPAARRELEKCAWAAGMTCLYLRLVPDAEAAAAFCLRRRLEHPLLPDPWPSQVCVVDAGAAKATVSLLARLPAGCCTDEAVDFHSTPAPGTVASFPECGGDRLDRAFLDLVAAKVDGAGSRFRRELAGTTVAPVRPEVTAVMVQWEEIISGSGSGGAHRLPWQGKSVTLQVSRRLMMSTATAPAPAVSSQGPDGLPEQQQQPALETEEPLDNNVSIELSEEEVRGVFDLVADALAGCITRWMTACNLTHLPVLLVGSLASSSCVAASVRASIRPLGGTAVLQGAVHVDAPNLRRTRSNKNGSSVTVSSQFP